MVVDSKRTCKDLCLPQKEVNFYDSQSHQNKMPLILEANSGHQMASLNLTTVW